MKRREVANYIVNSLREDGLPQSVIDKHLSEIEGLDEDININLKDE